MNCSWRRTLASVFLLLSLHNVRVLSQNAVPTGPLPLPSFRGPTKDYVGIMNQEPAPQKNNLITGLSNGVLQEIVPGSPSSVTPDYERGSEYYKPDNPQVLQLKSALQKTKGPLQLGPRFNIPMINNLQLQGPLNNVLPNNVQLTQAPPLNTIQTPSNPLGLSLNIPPVSNIPLQKPTPNIGPIQVGPTLQGPNFTEPPTLPFNQGLQYNISPESLATNSLRQLVNAPQLPEALKTRPFFNLSPNLENQYMQSMRLTPYDIPFARPSNMPSIVKTDCNSPDFLSTPNSPTSTSLKSFCPITQTPIQPMVYPESAIPKFQLPTTPISPSYQISTLPTVTPQSCGNIEGNFRKIADEFSPIPISLQINVPSPTIPEPKITIITAYPAAPATAVPVTTSDSSELIRSYGMCPPYPLPPIIIEGKRSRSRSWLPLFLIALFARDGNCRAGGCCCCPCNCPSSDTPIPFPIVVPTNNPIMVGNAKRTRKTVTKANASDKKCD